MHSTGELLSALKKYWGYDSFRPLQERIAQSLLAGADAAVIMPTGGGKSLCYQLPAVVLERTVVVISPLIALMQDQAAQLAQMGIPAAVLNSSQPWADQQEVMRAAAQGCYRLLYLSPERLARADTIGWLQTVPVAFFAIDEAHCISEWGHEFRPEYRQLSLLRDHFPDLPIAAFTASATRRVRHDILEQLKLRNPQKYIVSFRRPNLRYVVKKCEKGENERLLLSTVRAHEGSSVIVYAPTIARVEETVDFLVNNGIDAVPYHGQMNNPIRRRNQESWVSDEVRVLVGTIAFGLGINKPAVRAVIHLSLPKSLEQYYQEAGRAGRDGEPADCILLWQNRDVGLLAYFADQILDAAEKQRAWGRYRVVRSFVESKLCRHRQICLHFGEQPKFEKCGACDICTGYPEWLSRPQAKTATARKAAPAPKPAAIPVKPAGAPAGPRPDAELLEYMREWRRTVAQRENVAAFIVMQDASLEDLCRKRPRSLRELLQVHGFGEKKAEKYGAAIFTAIGKFEAGARVERRQAPRLSVADQTVQLLAAGKSLEEIAEIRGRRLQTIVEQVADLVEEGRVAYDSAWMPAEISTAIENAARSAAGARLRAIKDSLPGNVTYDQIRLVVARLRFEGILPSVEAVEVLDEDEPTP